MRRLVFAKLEGKSGNFHAAVTRIPARTRTLGHGHDFHEFFLVTRGTGTHHANGEVQALWPGMLVFMGPADIHNFSTRGEDLELINIAFAASWWRAFRSLHHPRRDVARPAAGQPVASIQLDPLDADSCRKAMMAMVNFSGELDGVLLELCLTLNRLFSRHLGGAASTAVPAWLEQLCRDMGDESLIGNDIRFWQDRSGRSPEHLARTCRRFFGATPTELLVRARIRYVKRALREGGAKTSAVALRAGFHNLGYFYRVFRHECGMTPQQWLRTSAGVTVPR